jgi:hypothetical protein
MLTLLVLIVWLVLLSSLLLGLLPFWVLASVLRLLKSAILMDLRLFLLGLALGMMTSLSPGLSFPECRRLPSFIATPASLLTLLRALLVLSLLSVRVLTLLLFPWLALRMMTAGGLSGSVILVMLALL